MAEQQLLVWEINDTRNVHILLSLSINSALQIDVPRLKRSEVKAE